MINSNVQGCLSGKNGRWYARVFWYEIHNGKKRRKEKWIATGLPLQNNKRNAERILKQLIRDKEEELQAGPTTVNRRMTVSEYMLFWLEYRKTDKLHPIREDTYEGYERKIKRHIVPYFDRDGLFLTELTAEHLDDFYSWLLEQGNSASSVRKIHANMHAALKRAVKLRLVYKNVAEDIERLPVSEGGKGDFYNEKELQELFTKCVGDPLETVIKLAAFYGLRRSEVLGLQWSSIDFDERTITIRSTAIQTNAGIQYADVVKSSKSRRTLLIPDGMLEYLQSVKHKQLQEKELCGDDYVESDYVCRWPDGQPISPYYVSHHFSDFLKAKGLRHIRFHDLRHSAASLLLSAGLTLKDVQDYLGHSTIAITADIYGHLDRERKVTVAEKMNSGLGSALLSLSNDKNIREEKLENENSRIFSREEDVKVL